MREGEKVYDLCRNCVGVRVSDGAISIYSKIERLMKKKHLFLLSGTCLLAAGTLQAAINFSDPASFYDESNWYAIRSDGTPTISKTENSISISGSKSDCLVFCYFEPVTLKQGESLQVSGTFNLDKLQSGANTIIGLFNSGVYAQDVLDAALAEKSLKHAYNSKSGLLASAVTGGMAGFLTSTKLTYNRNKPANNSTCLATNSGGVRGKNYEKEFSAPEAGKEYSFLLKILKTAEGTYSTTFSLGGGEAVTTESLSNDALKDLSVLAVRVPVGTGGSVTLSDLKFETATAVVPEPSAFGVFSGASALLLCLRRRKR